MSVQPRFTALVLAGSRGGTDPVAAAAGCPEKCLVNAGGVPMLVHVLTALRACPAVGGIVVVLQGAERLWAVATVGNALRETGAILLEGAATPSTSVGMALAARPQAFPWLITTADHPLLTPAMLTDFCDQSLASGGDVTAGLTGARVLLASYPASQRTWLRFSDDRYSGANLFALLNPRGEAAVRFWRRVEQERKRPWRIARAFGFVSLLAYLLGRLSLEEAMRRVSRTMGCEVRAIPLPYAEAAIDVDKPADLALVEQILLRRAS